jgi:hypothetical protein
VRQVVVQFLGELLFNAATPKQRTNAQTKFSGPARRVEEWLAVPLVLLADGDGWSYSFSTQ